MSRGRRRTVKGLVVLGSVLAFLSVFAIWVERQALNTDDWVTTSGQLLDNSTIRSALGRLPGRPALRKRQRREGTEGNPPRRNQAVLGAALGRPAAGGRRRRRKSAGNLDRPGALERSEPHHARTAGRSPRTTRATRSRPKNGDVTLNLGSLLTNLAGQVGIGANLAEKLPPDAGQIDDPPLRPAEDRAEHRRRGQGPGPAALDPHLRRLRRRDLLRPRRPLGDRAVLRHRADRRRLRGDRRPPHRRRDRRRPAGHRRQRQARARTPPGHRDLADDQHRDDA